MKTKTLLSLAAIVALPITVNAQNISGAMYTAPSAADTNHPAPTTGNSAPYGRIDIDTADQEHIATTAYVKGAYNSAIAAVNKVDSEKQAQITNTETGAQVLPIALGAQDGSILAVDGINYANNDVDFPGDAYAADIVLISGAALGGAINRMARFVNEKNVTVYTTWDDDSASATTTVTLN